MASVSELRAILESAGLKVNTDYVTAGEYGTFTPIGLLLHHDAGGLSYTDDWGGKDNVSVARYMAGSSVAGAQFWVGRSGTWYILCDGLKWHAGQGQYAGVPANSGNRYLYGIEVDYGPVRPGWSGPTVTESGYTWPVWDEAHKLSILAGSRALAKALGLQVFAGHREYAPTRKIDPAGFNLNAWRAHITSPDIEVKPAQPQPQPVPPTSTPNPLEYIMSLPGAPSTYDQAVKDIVNGVVRAMTDFGLPADADKAATIARTTERALGVARNRINHKMNYDGSKVTK